MAITTPFAHKVNRVSIIGDCFSSSEHWVTGFYLGAPDADASDPAGSAGAIGPLWSTFFTNTGSKVSNLFRTLQIKVATLGTDGKTDLEAVDWYDYPTPPVGGNTSSAFPPQVALAATITSEIQRGLAAKGRMYLPGVCALLTSTTAKISSTDTGTIATNFKTFLDAVNSSSSVAGNVILASHGHFVKATDTTPAFYALPKNAAATGCRVGDVYDTQRRRRNELPEVYTTKVLA